MLIDLKTTGGDLVRHAEVCVIGAGVAGITTARRLLAAGHQVILLESGGLDYEPEIAAMNAGENVGEPYYDLADARLRFFGGTTAIWGGRCATLDPIDLERRSWVPHSGWPIGWDDLARYYGEARDTFGFAQATPVIERLRAAGLPVPDFDPARLRMPLWSFDERFNRFTFEACADLREHPRCTIALHASVTAIEADASGRSITHITARAIDGGRLTVAADAIVLAAGGIENARMLLASRSVMPAGLGNDHDQVGRYFMEHPHARGGRLVSGDAWSLLKLFGKPRRLDGQTIAALITPSPDLQRERGILNTSLTLAARQPADARRFWGMRLYSGLKHDIAPTRGGRVLWMGVKKAASWAQRRADPARPWLLNKLGMRDIALLVRAEQAPNAASRVTIDPQARDALGIPRLRLDWRMSAIDKHSVSVLVETLGAELQRLGLGRIEPAAWLDDPTVPWRTDPLVSAHPIGGYHHMGTTRMSASAQHGVVNDAGRVHGIANLYVVGSSTFPTGGWANPTFTIAALALRTADGISTALRRPVAEPMALAPDAARDRRVAP